MPRIRAACFQGTVLTLATFVPIASEEEEFTNEDFIFLKLKRSLLRLQLALEHQYRPSTTVLFHSNLLRHKAHSKAGALFERNIL